VKKYIHSAKKQTRNEQMKRQATALTINKQSERQTFLSAGLVLVALSSNVGLMAGAQSINNQDLPPEVIPVNSAIKYVPNSVASNISTNQVPGIVSPAQPAPAPAYQSAQEARQEIFNSLMGTNVYPQFNGRPCAFSQAGNMAGAPTSSQGTQQTLSNNPAECNTAAVQSNLITPGQFNNNAMTTSYNNQTQTLNGPTNTSPTSQPRTSGGISSAVGTLGGMGLSGMSLINSSPGNYYSFGQLAGSMLWSGARTGFSMFNF
jgi:hypothetical protein